MVAQLMKQGPVLPEAVKSKDCAQTLWFSSLLLDLHLETGTFPDSSLLMDTPTGLSKVETPRELPAELWL